MITLNKDDDDPILRAVEYEKTRHMTKNGPFVSFVLFGLFLTVFPGFWPL